MATMFPKNINLISPNSPKSEIDAFNAISSLPKDYFVFHSFQWIERKADKGFTWYENDYLIVHRKYGILFLEVKGGKIYFKEGNFHQVNSITGEDTTIKAGSDPLSQAKRGIHYFRELIKNRLPNIYKRIDIEPCAWFTGSVIGINQNLPFLYQEAKSVILDSNDLKNTKQAFERIHRFYNSENKTRISEEELKQICDLIAPEFDLVLSPSVIKGELERMFLRLTTEQTSLLDYISEQRTATIQGAAGTGKTLIALEAAKRIAGEGKKVLFLCFNKYLYDHLKFDCPIVGVDFFNITTYVGQFTKKDINVARIRSQELQKIDIEKFDYEAVLIDEAQDLENDEILFFANMCELKKAVFFVFYDRNQLLSTRAIPEWISNSECKLVLSKNCRNTYQIACTSYNVIDLPIKAGAGMIAGTQPTITFVPEKSLLQLAFLIKHYKDDNNEYKDSEITILSMKPEEKSIMYNVNKIDGIVISKERNNNSVFYTTAKKFKGLESKVVIITDIDEDCFLDETQKRVFYVACSRATHRLSLFVSGNHEKIISIGKSIENAGFSPKGNIIMKTKTTELDL